MNLNKRAAIGVLALLNTLNLQADVKLPAVLSDNMVLQQQSNARIWGWASPGEKVTIKAAWEKEFSAPVTAGADGKWHTSLKTPKASGPHTITVRGANAITLENVLIGEVWVCSGQSNMEFRLPHAANGKQEVAEADCPQIRFFNVSGAYTAHPADDVSGNWSQTPKRSKRPRRIMKLGWMLGTSRSIKSIRA